MRDRLLAGADGDPVEAGDLYLTSS